MIFSSVNQLFFILVLLLLPENCQSYLVDFIGGRSGAGAKSETVTRVGP
jgi:hypothetical protein